MPKKNKTEEVSGEVVQKYGPKTVDVRFCIFLISARFYFFESIFFGRVVFRLSPRISPLNETLVFVSHVSLLWVKLVFVLLITHFTNHTGSIHVRSRTHLRIVQRHLRSRDRSLGTRDNLQSDWRYEGQGWQRWGLTLRCYACRSGCCEKMQGVWYHRSSHQVESHRWCQDQVSRTRSSVCSQSVGP